jgi:hypothetical protein
VTPGATFTSPPHPDYGVGVWSDDSVKPAVEALDASRGAATLVADILAVLDASPYGYDSIDRELAFWYWAHRLNTPYETLYQAWLNTEVTL